MDSSGKKDGGARGRGFSRREWDPVFASEKIIEKDVVVSGLSRDGCADIVRISLSPVWLHPVWSSPRDLCVLRYGREIKDSFADGGKRGSTNNGTRGTTSGKDVHATVVGNQFILLNKSL